MSTRSTEPVVREGEKPALAPPLDFAAVYDAHFAALWRNARALGIPPDAVDDVLQDVFIVVHRRLPAFDGRGKLRTWLTKILVRVVATHRRRYRRKGGHDQLPDDVRDEHALGPHDQTARREAARMLLRILDAMDEDQRAVFVLAEIEHMAVPEIAAAIGENVNTTYSRLRLARREYERHLARLRARDEWRGT